MWLIFFFKKKLSWELKSPNCSRSLQHVINLKSYLSKMVSPWTQMNLFYFPPVIASLPPIFFVSPRFSPQAVWAHQMEKGKSGYWTVENSALLLVIWLSPSQLSHWSNLNYLWFHTLYLLLPISSPSNGGESKEIELASLIVEGIGTWE